MLNAFSKEVNHPKRLFLLVIDYLLSDERIDPILINELFLKQLLSMIRHKATKVTEPARRSSRGKDEKPIDLHHLEEERVEEEFNLIKLFS
jgi:hypothetical protein